MVGLFRNFTRRRGSRTAPLWLAALVLLSSGCVATKSDIRRLQFDIAQLQQRQDSLYRDMLRQDRIVLDSLRRTGQSTRDIMSDLVTRMRELTAQFDRLSQLMAQTQQQIIASRSELEGLRQQQQQAQQQQQQQTGASPERLYLDGRTRFEEKTYSVARVLFQEIVRNHGNSTQAPDAQYYIAETYVMEEDYERAYQEYERIAERWPSHPRAGEGALRAGVVAEELAKNRTKARELYTRVQRQYPNSDVATQATRRLRALR